MTSKKEKGDNNDRGDWIQTFTGKRFYPLDPRVEDIDINDIAQSLSNQCRFAGHSLEFYSIAQHAVNVSLMCPSEHALWGLLHDASEVYLIDVPSPIKSLPEFEPYRKIEKKLMEVICQTYDLPIEEPASVKKTDKKMLATEARDLTLLEGRGWHFGEHEPYDFHIKPWKPSVAKIKFLSRFHELITVKKR